MCKCLVRFGFALSATQMSKTEVTRVGVLPIMAYTGRLRSKGVPFLGFRYMHFMAVQKSIKRSGVVVYSYFKGKCIDSSLKGYTYPK